MDLAYFLRERTNIVRLFYDKGRIPFEQMKRDIEEEVPPWEPPYSDLDMWSGEPAYLAEWMQAEQTRELVGMLAVMLLSDTLKLYFSELEREIGFTFESEGDRKRLFKQGFVEAYRQILAHIMGDRFETCSVRFDVIEQVVLARNDFTHNSDLLSFSTRHTAKTLERHPNPFFVDPERSSGLDEIAPGSIGNIEVNRGQLMEAIAEVEKLADWMSANCEAVWAWRDRDKLVREHRGAPS